MILYVNASVRKQSRTAELAKELLNCLGGEYTERKLIEKALLPLTEEKLEYRTKLTADGNFSDSVFDLAKEFASAEKIVVAAPYWNLCFPSILNEYLENVYVTGIVSKYSDEGVPEGMCRAKALYYVTTAGGPYDSRFSFDYIKELCTNYFGIREVKLIMAENLDIVGNDASEIIKLAKEEIHKNLQ